MKVASALPSIKPVVWIGSTKANPCTFPEVVKDFVGFALFAAQQGGKHASTKPLRGFGGAGVLEVIEDHQGDTYRAVYTVRLAGRMYVLHAFQKKSRTGVQTPKAEINPIKSRPQTSRGRTRGMAGTAQRGGTAWLKKSNSKREVGTSSLTSGYQIQKSVSLKLDLHFALPELFAPGGSLRLVQHAS